MSTVTKLGIVVTYCEGVLSRKSHDHLIMWSCEIMLQTESIISPLPQFLARWLSSIKSYDPLITWPCEITRDQIFISAATIPMATKLGLL